MINRYRIFRTVFREYHQHLSYMLDCMGACAEQLSNADILKVLSTCLTRSQGALHTDQRQEAMGHP